MNKLSQQKCPGEVFKLSLILLLVVSPSRHYNTLLIKQLNHCKQTNVFFYPSTGLADHLTILCWAGFGVYHHANLGCGCFRMLLGRGNHNFVHRFAPFSSRTCILYVTYTNHNVPTVSSNSVRRVHLSTAAVCNFVLFIQSWIFSVVISWFIYSFVLIFLTKEMKDLNQKAVCVRGGGW